MLQTVLAPRREHIRLTLKICLAAKPRTSASTTLAAAGIISLVLFHFAQIPLSFLLYSLFFPLHFIS